MTRVDIISVKEMSNQHIVSGAREIKRIPNKLKSNKYKLELVDGVLQNVPEHYTLNKGHERFFIDKIKFLHKRYIELYNEGISRGLNLTNYEESFYDVPTKFYNDWQPSERDKLINQQRITQRLLLRLFKGYYRWSN